jgi:hypothetical protein
VLRPLSPPTVSSDQFEVAFKAMDRDGDGAVDQREFEQVRVRCGWHTLLCVTLCGVSRCGIPLPVSHRCDAHRLQQIPTLFVVIRGSCEGLARVLRGSCEGLVRVLSWSCEGSGVLHPPLTFTLCSLVSPSLPLPPILDRFCPSFETSTPKAAGYGCLGGGWGRNTVFLHL